jgi:hypothetical protein
MAIVFPDSPLGALPPEVLRTFRFLKSLPDSYRVWHHLAPWQKGVPDFLLIDDRDQALLLKVSGASSSEARPAAQLVLLEDDRGPLGQAETEVLANFLRGLSENLPSGFDLGTAILFPNISEKLLNQSRPQRDHQLPLWLGKESLNPACVPTWLTYFRQPRLAEVALDRLRASFTPEVVVPGSLTVRTPAHRQLQADLTDFLLDFDQEAALKVDLDLSLEGEGLVRDLRLNVINGVAGSGKTLILLFRLRLLHELFPQKNFLVLTHNRAIIRDMESRFNRLHGRLPDCIEWRTFNSWCRGHWPADPPWSQPITSKLRNELLRENWRAHFSTTNLTVGMFRSELDWVKDQPIFSREDYMSADRKGRGFRLSTDQRDRMVSAIQAYQGILEARQWRDWGDVPRLMWKFIQEGRVKPPQYDAVLVDEAQFFAPLWFDIVRLLVKPRSGHLFIAADPTQGFLRRGTTWKSLGFQVRGHSYHLRRSYRTAYEILNFATLFYRTRIPQESEEEDILAPDLLNMPAGAVPQLIQLASWQDEIARVTNEVIELVKHGFPRQNILILHANWNGVQNLIHAICQKLGRHAAADPKFDYPGNYIRVTTLNAGAGLESPIVFLAGLHQLFEEEHSLRISDEEREELILENTRKIYMAITRAGQRLIFTYVGDCPEILVKMLGKK